jgi:hypothetical protein
MMAALLTGDSIRSHFRETSERELLKVPAPFTDTKDLES